MRILIYFCVQLLNYLVAFYHIFYFNFDDHNYMLALKNNHRLITESFIIMLHKQNTTYRTTTTTSTATHYYYNYCTVIMIKSIAVR